MKTITTTQELMAALAALPALSRTVYEKLQGAMYAEPDFSDVQGGHS